MKVWDIYAQVRAGKYLGTVEAETSEQAIEKGWELDSAHVSVCHQCSEHFEDPEIDSLTADELGDVE